MPFVVTALCTGVKDHACVDACPVDCFYEAEETLVINPEECVDCGACVPECPVGAIYQVANVPDRWKHDVARNAAPFGSSGGILPRAVFREAWEHLRLQEGSPAHRYYQRHGKA